ncbi:MAG: nucleotide exchange factor GrpE [Oscillospiraceae bacterium]|nr:nucleotide exchange factor GrpE [Oscillospiraceae bacterium]
MENNENIELEAAAETEAAEETPDIETVSPEQLKIEALEKQLAEEKDKYLRVVAEYDNFRKRSVNDRMLAVADAQSKVIIEILGVIDNFERALAAETTDENYKKGVEMIFNQYKSILDKLGVTEIEALGCTFDPNVHNAVNQVEDENFGENTVCQVFQKGYKLGDKVIRCAMVVIANP